MKREDMLRSIPRVDDLLRLPEIDRLIGRYGYCSVRDIVRRVLADFRRNALSGADDLPETAALSVADDFLETAALRVADAQQELDVVAVGEAEGLKKPPADEYDRMMKESADGGGADDLRTFFCRIITSEAERELGQSLRPVHNGTGILLHTGLGRAPLGEEGARHVMSIVKGYSTLEYDPVGRKRGDRNSHFESLLCRITGAEAAMAVNNNAAAVLLCLTVAGGKGEALVSRGELVEIGGQFRIPEVMELSGVKLREVGTTNRTRTEDYRRGWGDDTALLLKVHTSNYRIVGFTEEVTVGQLHSLREEMGKPEVPIVADLGSGVMVDTHFPGASQEPSVRQTVSEGADLVCFSGDKLMGGPQAGLIVGKKQWIEKLKVHPLARALRVGKFTAAALEYTLSLYLEPESVCEKIPVLKMLTASEEELRARAEKFCHELSAAAGELAETAVIPCKSQAGGGALPETELPSWGVSITPCQIGLTELEERLRLLREPVIGLLREGSLVLDMRTFSEEGQLLMIRLFREGDILWKKEKPQAIS